MSCPGFMVDYLFVTFVTDQRSGLILFTDKRGAHGAPPCATTVPVSLRASVHSYGVDGMQLLVLFAAVLQMVLHASYFLRPSTLSLTFHAHCSP